MKSIVVGVLLIVLTLNFSIAFSQKSEREKIYKTWVKTYSSREGIKGILIETKDTSILIAQSIHDLLNTTSEISVSDIDKLQFRRKGRAGKGALIGAASGLSTGAIIGFAVGRRGDQDFKSSEKAVGFGIALAIPGSIIGAIIGSIKVKIPIKGNIQNYQLQKKKLAPYIYAK
ncbi:MAG: hypothetical protein JNK77_01770 [Saprospiraceae bacterium]|nr:hypothetical protein [Saprospiraceae bacterium]